MKLLNTVVSQNDCNYASSTAITGHFFLFKNRSYLDDNFNIKAPAMNTSKYKREIETKFIVNLRKKGEICENENFAILS